MKLQKLLTFFLFFFLFSCILPGRSEAITSNQYCMDAEELTFISLINSYRASKNLPALKVTMTLGAGADHHSTDMATYNYFSHTLAGPDHQLGTPDDYSWSTNMTNHGYPAGTGRGENIAAGMDLASRALELFKSSPPHDANMLGSNYKAIGIGRAYNATSQYKWYWTTDFGTTADTTTPPPCSLVATPTPAAPTPTQAPINYVRVPYPVDELSSGTTVNQWKNSLIYIKKNMKLNNLGFYNTGPGANFELRSSESTGSLGAVIASGSLKATPSSSNYYYQDVNVNLNSGLYYIVRVNPTSGRYYFGTTSTYYSEMSFLRRSNGSNKAGTTGSFQLRLRFTLR